MLKSIAGVICQCYAAHSMLSHPATKIRQSIDARPCLLLQEILAKQGHLTSLICIRATSSALGWPSTLFLIVRLVLATVAMPKCNHNIVNLYYVNIYIYNYINAICCLQLATICNNRMCKSRSSSQSCCASRRTCTSFGSGGPQAHFVPLINSYAESHILRS